MNLQLVVFAGPNTGATFPLPISGKVQLGRAPNTLTQFTDTAVSRVHCELEIAADEVVVIDLNSSGGTHVNGQRTSRQKILPGDVIQIGKTRMRVEPQSAVQVPAGGPREVGPLPDSSMPLASLEGHALSHYEVGPVLARGQTGFIFQARDTQDDRTVALKVLNAEISRDEEEMQRFVRAMKTMMPLRHPNIVTIHGAGRSGPYSWIAMELVEGENLAQGIKRVGIDGTLHWRHALRVATHLARALDFAQQHHIIHRNITPTNVLIRKSDQVAKLGDLMLAKALDGKMAQKITRPGELLGDLCYMSPERTQDSTQVDGRSDLYSLGAMVYALLTGKPPFAGGNWVDVMARLRQAEPEKPRHVRPEIPELFERVVLQLLAKLPEDRHQTPAELLEDLEKVGQSRE